MDNSIGQCDPLLKFIAASLPNLTMYFDAAQVCRFANQKFCDWAEMSVSQVIGKTAAELLHSEFEVNRERITEVLGGKPCHFETKAGAEGAPRWWRVECLPHEIDQRTVGFCAFIADITQSKTIEEARARREALFVAFSRIAEIGGWEVDLQTGTIFQTDMLRDMFGLQSDFEVNFETIKRFHSEEAWNTSQQALAAAIANAETFDYTIPYVTMAGEHRWQRSVGEPILAADKVIGIVGATQDVTSQKNLEAELARAQKLESIGQLSAGIAHEINTPSQFIGNNIGFVKDAVTDLIALVGKIEVRLLESADAAARDSVAEVLRECDFAFLKDEIPRALEQSTEGIDRIQRIVLAMKDFSHPAVDKTRLDLNRAIDSTIVVASNEWKYVADLETHFDRELPEVMVMPGGFNQVILNMIVNAAHAIAAAGEPEVKGKIRVSTRRNAGWAEVRIQDSGCGIPEAIRDRIFDPFFTTKPVGKGTGQGLAIAHDVIVNKHQGTIDVESEPGMGTTFIVRLPLHGESAQADAAKDGAAAGPP